MAVWATMISTSSDALRSKWLARNIATDADVKRAVNCWLHTRDAGSLYARIQALVPRSGTCLMSVPTTMKSGVYHVSHTCTSKSE